MKMGPDSYGNGFGPRTRGYRVLSSTREGMLNHVDLFATTNARFGSLVLEGFDLNCCQAGLDLASGLIITTPAFRRFLSNGQLMVTNVATPYHTTIRLAKKHKEYGCYCSLDTEASILATAGGLLERGNRHNRNNIRHAARFGTKYRDLWLQYREQLETVSSIERVEGTRYELYQLKYSVPDVTESLVEIFRRSRKCVNSQTIARAFDLRCRPTTPGAHRERFRQAALAGTNSLTNAISDNNYLDCRMPPENQLGSLERFLVNHKQITRLFAYYGLNQLQQVEAMKMVEAKEDEHGLLFTGMVESMGNHNREYAGTMEEYLELVEAEFRSRVKGGELVEPADLSRFSYSGAVRELTSYELLQREGKEMRHCVGGYFREVARLKGQFRIFGISDPSGRSTVAIASGRIFDHKSRLNSPPPPEHQKIAQELAGHLPWEKLKSPYPDFIGFLGGDIPF